MSSKIFGIGLPRTGTTSLCEALDILEFRPALHNPWSPVEIAQCGSATDITIAWRFDRLAKLWPEAKFVYTMRDAESWLTSSERHYFAGWINQAHLDYRDPRRSYEWAWIEATLAIFGTLEFSRTAWVNARANHEDAIRKFFMRWRTRSILSIDITSNISDNVKWQMLCAFLDRPVPDVAFPHANRSPKLDRSAEQA